MYMQIKTAYFYTEPECNDNAVRLVQNDELESNFSVVQLCMYGMWSFIGGNSWDDTEAAVICAELGFLPLSKQTLLINT